MSLKTIGTLTAAEMLAELEDEPEQREPGWLTCREWANFFSVERARAGELLRKAEDRGKVIRRKFKLMTNRGIYPVTTYKWIGKPNQPSPAPTSQKRHRS